MQNVLERFGFLSYKPISNPLLKDAEVSRSRKDDIKKYNYPYREAVGALMYLMYGSGTDLAYSVGILSRLHETPLVDDVS